MSHYTQTTTLFKDQKALIEALTLVGLEFCGRTIRFKPEMIEVHEEPQHLYGYQGDRRQQKAHIIIRRRFIDTASNDIGFLRLEDGTYQAIVSEFDRGMGYNDQWLKRVKQAYAQSKSVAALKKQGMRVTTKQEGNRIRVVAYGR